MRGSRPGTRSLTVATAARGPASGARLGRAAAADDQVGHEPGPAGLVRGAEAHAGVAVEVLVERDLVVPRRVALEQLVAAEHGAAAVPVVEEDAREPRGQLVGDLRE